jgi:hypothetical protein
MFRLKPHADDAPGMRAKTFSFVSITPFGAPVVPDV